MEENTKEMNMAELNPEDLEQVSGGKKEKGIAAHRKWLRDKQRAESRQKRDEQIAKDRERWKQSVPAAETPVPETPDPESLLEDNDGFDPLDPAYVEELMDDSTP